MRLTSLIVLAFVGAAAGALSAQPASAAPEEAQHWSVPVGYGPISTSGSGARLVVPHAEGGFMSVRHRLGESRWWIGVDLDFWSSAATPEGVDSLVVRSKVPDVYAGNGADFESVGYALSTQYDAWRSDRFTGYILVSIGGNGQAGFIHPLCTVYYGPCEHTSTWVSEHATHPTGMAGLGVRMRLFDSGSEFLRWVPRRLFAEARVANEGTQDGRVTMTPLQFGLSW